MMLKKISKIYFKIFLCTIIAIVSSVVPVLASSEYDLETNVEYKLNTLERNGFSNNSIIFNINMPQDGRVKFEINDFADDIYGTVFSFGGGTAQCWNTGVDSKESGWIYRESGQYRVVIDVEGTPNAEAYLKIIYQDDYYGEKESNDQFEDATLISQGEIYEGRVDGTYDEDIFKLNLDATGLLDLKTTVNSTNNLYESNINIYKEDINGNISQIYSYTSGIETCRNRLRLSSGLYYIKMENYYTPIYSYISDYSIYFEFVEESYKDFEQETNNIMSYANEVDINHDYTGNFNDINDKDYYKFEVSNRGYFQLELNTSKILDNELILISLFDNEKNLLNENSSSKKYTSLETGLLEQGEYYVCIKANKEISDVDGKINNLMDYYFKVVEKPIVDVSLNKSEMILNKGNSELLTTTINPSDTIDDKTLTWKSSNTSVATVNNGKVMAVSPGTATITVKTWNNKSATCTVTVPKIKMSSTKLIVSTAYYTGSNVKPMVTVEDGSKTLKSGTDYTVSYSAAKKVGAAVTIKITGKGNYTGTVTKTVKIAKKPVSKLTIKGVSSTKAYTGKAIKPAITVYNGSKKLTKGTDYTVTYGTNKNTGKATVKITGKGNYTGSVTKTFYIVPKAVTLSSVTAGTKKATVKYKKATGASGYQIAYKVSGGSWKYVNTTSVSKTISSLSKGKKYTFKVRAYKTVSGTKYYGSYSSSKTVTIK